ncbi:MAG: TetR/AcrR family transcriptional regulator [Acidobacteriota bacterium]
MASQSSSAEAPSRGYHHGDLRASLVAAGTELLETHGTGGLSLRSVARAAGVSHAAPYRHFKDKHELLEAVAAAGFRRLEACLDDACLRFPDDPKRQVKSACRIYVRETLDHPHRAHLMFGGFLDAERRSAELESAIETSFGKLVATIRRGEGRIYRPLPTRELVLTLWSATHGLAMLAAAGQLTSLDPDSDPETRMDQVMEHILEGLALRRPDGAT